jgi:NAD(P)-dependent dehydrogenase (short-subunit alcohol dehydrogenase family)
VTEAAPPVAELLNFGGSVALVTEASGGVGAGIVRRVVEAGAAVVVHYGSDADGAMAVVDAIGAAGSRAIAARAEFLDPAAPLTEPTRFRHYGVGSPDARRLLPGYKTTGCAS